MFYQIWFVLCLLQVSFFEKIISSNIQSRVVGGEATTIEKLGGYLVALRYKGEFTCGGTLVHELIVISAQHCFLGRKKTDQWIAEGGITMLHEDGHKVQVDAMIKPAAFRIPDLHMDVAVLKLHSPMIGSNIKPIPLCSGTWQKGDQMTVSGWGLVDPNASAPHHQIRTATLPVIGKKTCRALYAAAVNVTDSQFCAGVLGQKDACTYDSGGPLTYNGELCGIVSYGIGCAENEFPGVYTNINYVKPFIAKSIDILLASDKS